MPTDFWSIPQKSKNIKIIAFATYLKVKKENEL